MSEPRMLREEASLLGEELTLWTPERVEERLDVGETAPEHRGALRRGTSGERPAKPLRDELPTPQVPQREASSDEVPRNAAKLAKLAREAGWRTSVVYSRSASGVDHVSVRCSMPGDRFSDQVACTGLWSNGRFAYAIVGVPEWPRSVKAGELASYVAGRPAGWFTRTLLRWEHGVAFDSRSLLR